MATVDQTGESSAEEASKAVPPAEVGEDGDEAGGGAKEGGGGEGDDTAELDENGLQTGGTLSKAKALEFFSLAIERISSEETRAAIAAKTTESPLLRPNAHLVQLQQELLEEVGVEQGFGRRELNKLSSRHGGDADFMAKLKAFTIATNEAHIAILKAVQPSPLKTEGSFTKEQIVEFMGACNSQMALPKTKAALRQKFLETQQPPGEDVVEIQRDMLECLGWDKDHGVACLNRMPLDFPDDAELEGRMREFALTAQMGVQEAVYGEEQMKEQMRMKRAFVEGQQRVTAELSRMSTKDQRSFANRMKGVQAAHMKVMMDLSAEDRRKYMQGLSPEENLDLAMFNRLVGGPSQMGGGGGGHSHGHGHQCDGNHSHGGHGHGGMGGGGGAEHPAVGALAAAAAAAGGMGAMGGGGGGGHSHDHQHRQCCNHGHEGHEHSKTS